MFHTSTHQLRKMQAILCFASSWCRQAVTSQRPAGEIMTQKGWIKGFFSVVDVLEYESDGVYGLAVMTVLPCHRSGVYRGDWIGVIC